VAGVRPLLVRRATPADYVAVAELTLAAYLPALKFGADDPYRDTLADSAGRAASAELLVAEQDGNLVGTVTLCRPGTPYAEIAGPDELEVRMLAVAPAAQRSGIGATLMAHAHEAAAREGLDAVVLSVVDTNERAAAFYRSLGYRRDPARDWTPVPHVLLQVSRLRVRPA
jgi:ribosomal protein S18 acetylase RimI-like enzyme